MGEKSAGVLRRDLKHGGINNERNKEMLGQLGKVMRGRSGSMGMMEDIVKRKKEEMERGPEGMRERREYIRYSKKVGIH